MKRLHVSVVRDKAQGLVIEDGALRGVEGGREIYEGNRVVIATGGVSYPLTGTAPLPSDIELLPQPLIWLQQTDGSPLLDLRGEPGGHRYRRC